ncbi:MAG: hypothetical protein EBZ48_07530 [Proteobacteria bacterium]|nr:hypothetical protein [Pseudomonadota bacterium]
MQALVGSQETLAQVVQELNATNANSQISKEIVEQLIPLAVERSRKIARTHRQVVFVADVPTTRPAKLAFALRALG